MTPLKTLTLSFSDSHQAIALYVPKNTAISEIIETLVVHNQTKISRFIQYFLQRQPVNEFSSHPVIVLNGGTAQLAPDLQQKLAVVLQEGLAQIVAKEKFTLITGGTDAGIFSLLGDGLNQWGIRAPCIGVCVAAKVIWLSQHTVDKERVPLEPHHSHFLLVEGESWGDELKIMSELADYLSSASALITIFAGGGEMTLREMQNAVEKDRQMILLNGSGRITDQVLAASRGETVTDQRVQSIAQKGKIVSFSLDEGPQALQTLVRQCLKNPS